MQDARYKCNQLGHIKKIHKSLQEQVEAKVAKDHLEGQQLFAMSYFTSDNWSTKVWLFDGGCTNHAMSLMYGWYLFKELNKTSIFNVRIEYGVHIIVKGKPK